MSSWFRRISASGRLRALAPCVAALLTAAPALAQTPAPMPADPRALDAGGMPLRGSEPTQAQSRNISGAANYGRPVKAERLPKRNPPPHKNARPLPETGPHPGAPTGKGRALPPPTGLEPAPTVAATPGLPRARRKVEDDPYEPLGVDAGGLRLTPYSETSAGYDSNAARANGGVKASPVLREELGFGLKSDWSNHDLKAEMRAGYSEYLRDKNSSRPDAAGKLNARIDVTRDTKIEAETRFGLDTQRPGSLELPSGGANPVKGRPWIATYGASLGVTHSIGRLSLGLRGSVDRADYEDATYADGTKLKLSDSNYTAYELRSRAAYEIAPGVSPFVEAYVDRRLHDATLDSGGYARASRAAGARAGAAFELTRQLKGEVSAGYVNRKYDDARLADMRGPTFDASLVWNASPLTTVTLRGTTTASESTLAGASGSLVHRGQLEIGHQLLRNFTLSGVATFQKTTYTGASPRENYYAAGLAGEYKFSREVSLRASWRHETSRSNVAGQGYSADVFMLGLKLQR